VKTILDVQKSGNQDQITAAHDALQQAITQLQTDLPGLQQARGSLNLKV
jgi:hypothetical protein